MLYLFYVYVYLMENVFRVLKNDKLVNIKKF